MKNVQFESILGEEIKNVSYLGVIENNFDEKIHVISEPKVTFLDKKIEQIVITTNVDNIIERVLVLFPEPIDTTFYRDISSSYSSNYDVFVPDKVLSEKISSNEVNNDSFKETIRQTTMTLKKGNIADSDIIYIFWDKKSYVIKLYYNYSKNRIDLYFINE